MFEGGLAANRRAGLGGVMAILLDTTGGSVGVEGLGAISLRRLLGGAMAGVPIVFSHHALAAPAGREASLMADAGSRATLRDRVAEWGAGFAVSTAEGERFDIERDGVRYLATGITDDRVDAVILTIEGGAVTDVRWLTVPRDGEDGARGFWLRWRGFAEEHIALAEWLTYGLGAGWGALLIALGFLFRRKTSIP